MKRRFLERISERGGGLGEDDWIGRDFLFVAGLVDTAAGKLLGMVMIILPDADDVLRQRPDRRGKLDAP